MLNKNRIVELLTKLRESHERDEPIYEQWFAEIIANGFDTLTDEQHATCERERATRRAIRHELRDGRASTSEERRAGDELIRRKLGW